MQEHSTQSKVTYPFSKANLVISHHNQQDISLQAHIEKALNSYLVESAGYPVTGLYNTVLAAIEPPLLKVILEFCKTQDEAAKVLGLSRGTLRKKLKQYDFMTN